MVEVELNVRVVGGVEGCGGWVRGYVRVGVSYFDVNVLRIGLSIIGIVCRV